VLPTCSESRQLRAGCHRTDASSPWLRQRAEGGSEQATQRIYFHERPAGRFAMLPGHVATPGPSCQLSSGAPPLRRAGERRHRWASLARVRLRSGCAGGRRAIGFYDDILFSSYRRVPQENVTPLQAQFTDRRLGQRHVRNLVVRFGDQHFQSSPYGRSGHAEFP
jgi:hypothetical protein